MLYMSHKRPSAREKNEIQPVELGSKRRMVTGDKELQEIGLSLDGNRTVCIYVRPVILHDMHSLYTDTFYMSAR